MNTVGAITFRTHEYQPGTGLDEQLAALGYACIAGWSDQRPITAGLVRSRLAPHPRSDSHDGQRPILITGHTGRGRLVAAAAVRPSSIGGPGRLWGPIVHPDHQGQGLGRHLLNTLQPHLEPSQQLGLSTAEIPATRTRAGAFFTCAGWSISTTLQLVKGTLHPPDPAGTELSGKDVGASELSHLAPAHEQMLADLYTRCHPQTSATVAAATYARWSSDERFTPDCALAIKGDGRLLAAVLIYPLAPPETDHRDDAGEPAEALVGDILSDPTLSTRTARDLVRPLLSAALTHARQHHHAVVARALIDRRDAVAVDALTSCGLTARELFHCYQRIRPDATGTSGRAMNISPESLDRPQQY